MIYQPSAIFRVVHFAVENALLPVFHEFGLHLTDHQLAAIPSEVDTKDSIHH